MEDADFEEAVNSYYEPMYRFGLSLTRSEDEAAELTQEAFYRYAEKGRTLREKSKTKSWLFTTLYRIFLGWKRRESRLQHFEIGSVDHELPTIAPATVGEMDAKQVVEALGRLDERFRAPVALYYLESRSYREIAEILGVPAGTVMSRLSRGKAMLKEMLLKGDDYAGRGDPGRSEEFSKGEER
jgi:RNA polymerase sigma-70 factor (ECF subfamily)